MDLQIGLSLHLGEGEEFFAWGGPVFLYLSLLLLDSFFIDSCLWLFWGSCSLGSFACMYNGPLTGGFSIVPSCCMISSLTPLLFNPHPRNVSFRYGIEDIICIWKDMGWYFWLGCLLWCCWPVFLCCYCCLVVLWWYSFLVFLLVCWRWFGPFWWWNVFPKFL